MRAKRHTPNQVIRKLREAELLLGEGKSTAEVAKALGVSENTFHRWRNQYGGMKAEDAKQLKELNVGSPACTTWSVRCQRGGGEQATIPKERSTPLLAVALT